MLTERRTDRRTDSQTDDRKHNASATHKRNKHINIADVRTPEPLKIRSYVTSPVHIRHQQFCDAWRPAVVILYQICRSSRRRFEPFVADINDHPRLCPFVQQVGLSQTSGRPGYNSGISFILCCDISGDGER